MSLTKNHESYSTSPDPLEMVCFFEPRNVSSRTIANKVSEGNLNILKIQEAEWFRLKIGNNNIDTRRRESENVALVFDHRLESKLLSIWCGPKLSRCGLGFSKSLNKN